MSHKRGSPVYSETKGVKRIKSVVVESQQEDNDDNKKSVESQRLPSKPVNSEERIDAWSALLPDKVEDLEAIKWQSLSNVMEQFHCLRSTLSLLASILPHENIWDVDYKSSALLDENQSKFGTLWLDLESGDPQNRSWEEWLARIFWALSVQRESTLTETWVYRPLPVDYVEVSEPLVGRFSDEFWIDLCGFCMALYRKTQKIQPLSDKSNENDLVNVVV